MGLVLLPIVGNAAEHVTAVTASYKGKMNLAIGVAVGSSLQISLLVMPFLVLVGWAIGQPLSLNFDGFETSVSLMCVRPAPHRPRARGCPAALFPVD